MAIGAQHGLAVADVEHQQTGPDHEGAQSGRAAVYAPSIALSLQRNDRNKIKSEQSISTVLREGCTHQEVLVSADAAIHHRFLDVVSELGMQADVVQQVLLQVDRRLLPAVSVVYAEVRTRTRHTASQAY